MIAPSWINQGKHLREDRFQETELFIQLKDLEQCLVHSKFSISILLIKYKVNY